MTTRKSPTEMLAELEAKRQQIEARIAKEKAKVRQTERKADTRRKIIAGALALEHMAIDDAFGAELRKLIAKHVERPQDRALFDLPPK